MSSTMPFDLNLKGRTALVCGASAGIGLAAAKTLSRQGARVIAIARTEATLLAAAREIPNCTPWALDLNNHQALEVKLEQELNHHGPIGILINNSAGPKGGPLIDAKAAEFIAAFQQHLLTNQLLVQKLTPGMKDLGFGRIINVISTSVYAPIPGLGVSNTIRGAVASWAKTLSLELGPYGITVNSVLPGYTQTARLKTLIEQAAHKTARSETVVAEEWKNQIPARRFAEPEEVAAAIGFLASPIAGYISGVALAVDGGRLPVI